MLSVCLFVCLSVTMVDCDHIGWNSSKIISRLVSLGCLLSADPNIRGTPGNFAQSDPPSVDLSIGVESCAGTTIYPQSPSIPVNLKSIPKNRSRSTLSPSPSVPAQTASIPFPITAHYHSVLIPISYPHKLLPSPSHYCTLKHLNTK